MIKNEKQLGITKDLLKDFEDAKTKLSAEHTDNLIQKEVRLNALNNDIRKFKKDITDYERLKNNKTSAFTIPEFRLCYEALIKARIAKGWTQAELAEKVGLKVQQIQRYEASNYSTASLPRIDDVIFALGINISLHVTGLPGQRFNVPEEYTEAAIMQMQQNAKRQKALLPLT